jgi:flagellar biosynthesis chaperone FliJ
MKKFRFSLQALQTLRQRQEHDALERYGAAVQTRTRATLELTAAQRQLEIGWELLREAMSGQSTLGTLTQLKAYCERVEEQRQQCLSAVEAAQALVVKAWEALLFARQQKALDELANRRMNPTLPVLESVGDHPWN